MLQYMSERSSQWPNSHLLENYIQKLQETDDRNFFLSQSQAFESQLYQQLPQPSNPPSKQLYQQPYSSAVRLNIPQPHSLADCMLRSTLGRDQKYAQQYLQITNLAEQQEEDEKQRRIAEARRRFASSNARGDPLANTKSFMSRVKLAEQRPVIDNELEVFVRTNLALIGKPGSNKQEYSHRQPELIAKKIFEMGGIQDTIAPIEQSLSAFELKSVHGLNVPRALDSKLPTRPATPLQNISHNTAEKADWLEVSKRRRESLASQFLGT